MKPKYILIIAVLALGLVYFMPGIASADYSEHSTDPKVKRFTPEGTFQNEFLTFDHKFGGGMTVATGDFDGDGVDDIAVGAGPGGGPQVQIYKAGGQLMYSFFPFHPDFRGGVSVAAGDFTGDGKAELVVAQRSKGQAWVKVYEVRHNWVLANFMVYDPGHQGGAYIAVGDINGDGKNEIITSPASTNRCHVRTFSANGTYAGWDAFPFADNQKGGCTVAVANVDGGPETEVVVGMAAFGTATVRTYKTNSGRQILGEFLAYPLPYSRGVQIGAGDFDNDGEDEIVTVPTLGPTHMRMFEAYGKAIENENLFAHDQNTFRGGGYVAGGSFDRGKRSDTLVVAPSKKQYEGLTDYYKYIDIDLSDQTLRAYREGDKVYETLVSSGISRYPTPQGTFAVRDHILSERMKWEYGPDHPDNYDLEDVPHVMHFNGPYALHGAYWHNNFGHIMSHGCINLPLGAAEWLYNWADNGDTVIVHE
ncbi:MAG: L,D-transpeptidase family protein [bacterium]